MKRAYVAVLDAVVGVGWYAAYFQRPLMSGLILSVLFILMGFGEWTRA